MGVGPDAVFPALPELGYLEFACSWNYPAPAYFEGLGRALLRVWNVADAPFDYVAMVTELGAGLSVTNGADDIARALSVLLATDDARALGGGHITLIEHWPADQTARGVETYDQVAFAAGSPRWRPIHPTAPTHPDHKELAGWFERHCERIESALHARDDAVPGIAATLNEPPPQWRAATLQLMILIAEADLSNFLTLSDRQRRSLALLLADILAEPGAPSIHELAQRVHRAVQADTAGRRHREPYEFLVQAVDTTQL